MAGTNLIEHAGTHGRSKQLSGVEWPEGRKFAYVVIGGVGWLRRGGQNVCAGGGAGRELRRGCHNHLLGIDVSALLHEPCGHHHGQVVARCTVQRSQPLRAPDVVGGWRWISRRMGIAMSCACGAAARQGKWLFAAGVQGRVCGDEAMKRRCDRSCGLLRTHAPCREAAGSGRMRGHVGSGVWLAE
jgi:hypothetical protein